MKGSPVIGTVGRVVVACFALMPVDGAAAMFAGARAWFEHGCDASVNGHSDRTSVQPGINRSRGRRFMSERLSNHKQAGASTRLVGSERPSQIMKPQILNASTLENSFPARLRFHQVAGP